MYVVYREDGKDCMKFYTDSTYFVELWVREMEKEMEEKKSELNKKRDKKKVRPAQLVSVIFVTVSVEPVVTVMVYIQMCSDLCHICEVTRNVLLVTDIVSSRSLVPNQSKCYSGIG